MFPCFFFRLCLCLCLYLWVHALPYCDIRTCPPIPLQDITSTPSSAKALRRVGIKTQDADADANGGADSASKGEAGLTRRQSANDRERCGSRRVSQAKLTRCWCSQRCGSAIEEACSGLEQGPTVECRMWSSCQDWRLAPVLHALHAMVVCQGREYTCLNTVYRYDYRIAMISDIHDHTHGFSFT